MIAVDRPQRRGQDDAALDHRRRAARPRRAASRPGPRDVGWAPQQPALYTRLSVAENLELFARLEKVDDPGAGGRADARPDGPRRARRRARGPPVGRKPPARERRARADRRAARARARRALGLARPRSARAAVGVHRRPRRRGHDRAVLDAQRRPRRSATRAARSCWRTGGCCSTALPRRSCASRACRAATSSTRSSPSCVHGRRSGGTALRWLLRKDLLILGRSRLLLGGADPLPGRDRAADRLRDLAQPRASRGWRSSTKPRRARPCRWAASGSA